MQIKRMAEADYHLYYGGPNLGMRERVKFLLGIQPGQSGPMGLTRNRPGLFWSLDDDWHNLSPLNQAYLWNGYKTTDGKILGAGDSCGIVLPGGEEVLLWEYGKEYYGVEKFLPERNREQIRLMDEMLGSIDGVHFTTKRLADAYEPYVKNRFVFPNCIHLPDWDVLPKQGHVRDDPDEVRVLWQGGASHFADLMSVQPSMERMVARYPKLRWIFWGADFPWVHRVFPDENFSLMPWMGYTGYKAVLGALDFDFSMAPLVRHPFNDGKSSIKVYESAALTKPRPALAANVPPYSDDLVDGETAMLYSDANEFEDRFIALVEDAQLRNRIAQNCQNWLREERNPDKWIPKLMNWMEESRGSGYAMPRELGTLMNDLVSRGAFRNDVKAAREILEKV